VVGIRERSCDLRFFHPQDAKAGTLAKYIRGLIQYGMGPLA